MLHSGHFMCPITFALYNLNSYGFTWTEKMNCDQLPSEDSESCIYMTREDETDPNTDDESSSTDEDDNIPPSNNVSITIQDTSGTKQCQCTCTS